MNFSHYLGLVSDEKVQKFIFAQGNRPAAKLSNGEIKLLSETFLFKEDLESILNEVQTLASSHQGSFYLNGQLFKFENLSLKDSAVVHILSLIHI